MISSYLFLSFNESWTFVPQSTNNFIGVTSVAFIYQLNFAFQESDEIFSIFEVTFPFHEISLDYHSTCTGLKTTDAQGR